jgi:hypothetical protein
MAGLRTAAVRYEKSEWVAHGTSRPTFPRTGVAGRYNLSTPELFAEHVETMKSQSFWAGESWLHPVECRQMRKIAPPSQQFHSKTKCTAFPILFVSNTLDPITPLLGARKMHAHFPGTALLCRCGGDCCCACRTRRTGRRRWGCKLSLPSSRTQREGMQSILLWSTCRVKCEL